MSLIGKKKSDEAQFLSKKIEAAQACTVELEVG